MDAARMDTPKLYELVRMLGDNGAEMVMLLLKAMLADFIAFTGTEWSPAMIDSLLGTIKTNYGHLTMAQWKLFFEKAKSGVMAQEGQRENQTMIARITPMIFTQWLLNYSARCEEANEEFYAFKERNRAGRPAEGDYVSSERLKEALESFVDNWEAEINKVEESERETLREKQIEGYAKLHNLDIDKIRQEFKKKVA
jgi:hypothetical protein